MMTRSARRASRLASMRALGPEGAMIASPVTAKLGAVVVAIPVEWAPSAAARGVAIPVEWAPSAAARGGVVLAVGVTGVAAPLSPVTAVSPTRPDDSPLRASGEYRASSRRLGWGSTCGVF